MALGGGEGRVSPPSARVTNGQLCSWHLLQVAAKALETGMFGAYFNVLINLKDITDNAFKDQVSRRPTGAGPCSGTWRLPSGLWFLSVGLGKCPSAEMFSGLRGGCCPLGGFWRWGAGHHPCLHLLMAGGLGSCWDWGPPYP